MGALDRLLDGDRPPDQILVEASGVADPSAIADVATLHPGLSRDLVVVLADAETVRARHADERLQDTVNRQLAAADLIVLNKCDRIAETECGSAESWLRDRSRVPVIRSVAADVPMELLAADRADGAAPSRTDGASDHYHQFRSQFVPCPDPVDPGRLRAAFEELSPRVLRAKGFVRLAASPQERESDSDVGPGWLVVQVSGRAVEIDAWSPRADQPAPAPGIVFIGLDDLPPAAELRAALRGASPETSSPPAPGRGA